MELVTGYLATYYPGQLPAASRTNAMVLGIKQTLKVQRSNAKALFQFLQTDQNDLRDLNGDHSFFTALVVVPDSNRVKLDYDCGLGTVGIRQIFRVAGKLFTLFGEGGGDIGLPQAIVLEAKLQDKV